MITFGLLGWPITHSRSPQIHSLALKLAGLQGAYELFPIEPERKAELAAMMKKVREGQITGLNVTIPYKQEVMPFLDALSPNAKNIGAVNTITFKNGKVTGHNTDAPGFEADLANNGLELSYKPGEAVVFGAGGAARAVFYAFLNNGWQIHAFVRNVEKSKQVVADLRGKGLPGGIKLYGLADLSHTLKRNKIDVIVDTTPLGMAPHIDSSSWPSNVKFPGNCLVYDLVYNPENTLLMKQATAAGLRASNGWGMLVEQALLSFEIWTNVKINRADFNAAWQHTTHTP